MPEPNSDSTAWTVKLEAKLAALSPDERAKLEADLEAMASEMARVGQAANRYQKDLLRRLGVRTNIDDFEERYVQLLAAAEYVGISPERFCEMTPRQLWAVLEHRATELETLRRADAKVRKRRTRKPNARKGRLTRAGGSLEGDTTPFGDKTSVTLPEAESYLGIGSRHRRKLMKAGKLDVIGEGSKRRITVASLTRYSPPKEKAN